MYGISSPLVKLAVLVFIWRIFPTPTVRIGFITLSSITIAWAVSVQMVNLLQCRPLHAIWDIQLQALSSTHCLDFIIYYLSSSIANSVIDFATLMFPIQEILKLQMPRSRKIGMCGIFLLGGM